MSYYEVHSAPLKSVIISGNLNNSVVYKLCPITEFSEGIWNLTLLSVGYSCNVPNFNSVCSLSCNLITSSKFNSNFEVELYEQPLGMFLIKSGPPATINFEKTWFHINTLSNELKISIKNERNREKLKVDCDMYIQVLFRRVK